MLNRYEVMAGMVALLAFSLANIYELGTMYEVTPIAIYMIYLSNVDRR